MSEIDNLYVDTINGYMCSDFCVCPGIPTDPWVKRYRDIKEEDLKKYKRTQGLTGDGKFTGKIELFRETDYKPLIFAYDPATELESANLKELSSESFIDCLDNQDNFIEKYRAQQLAEYKEQYPDLSEEKA